MMLHLSQHHANVVLHIPCAGPDGTGKSRQMWHKMHEPDFLCARKTCRLWTTWQCTEFAAHVFGDGGVPGGDHSRPT